MKKILMVIILSLLFSCSKKDPVQISGTYTGQNIELKVSETEGKVTGTLTKDGKTYPVEGTVEKGTLSGSFKSGEDKFDFTASLEGSTLTFKSGESTYKLSKVTKANPLDKQNPLEPKTTDNSSTTNKASKGQPKVDPTVKTYSFQDQLFFELPKEWDVKINQGYLEIVLDNQLRDENGTVMEIISVAYSDAKGINSIDDDRVKNYFDLLVGQLYNNRMSFVEKGSIDSKLGKGISLSYEGLIGDNDMQVKIYCTLYDGEAIYVYHTAREDLFAKREKGAKTIFKTLRTEKGESSTKTISSQPDPQNIEGMKKVRITNSQLVTYVPKDWNQTSTGEGIAFKIDTKNQLIMGSTATSNIRSVEDPALKQEIVKEVSGGINVQGPKIINTPAGKMALFNLVNNNNSVNVYCIMNGQSLSTLIYISQDNLSKKAIVEKILSTIRTEKLAINSSSPKDSSLYGTWRYRKKYQTGGNGAPYLVSTTIIHYTFQASGRVQWNYEYQMGGSAIDRDKKSNSGSWMSKGGVITISWDNGVVENLNYRKDGTNGLYIGDKIFGKQ